MKRHPDPLTIPYKNWCYVHGYVLAGFEKLHAVTGDRRYFDYIRKIRGCACHRRRRSARIHRREPGRHDGRHRHRRRVPGDRRDPRYRRAAERIRRSFDDYPRNSDGGFWHARNLRHEMWIDGVFMGQMFLTRYGSAIGDRQACFDEAVRQVDRLADPAPKGDTGLCLHGYDGARAAPWADKVTGLSSDVWSEGLGWYALVLPEILALIGDHPGRGSVQAILRTLVEGLARVTGPAHGALVPGGGQGRQGRQLARHVGKRDVRLCHPARRRAGMHRCAAATVPWRRRATRGS